MEGGRTWRHIGGTLCIKHVVVGLGYQENVVQKVRSPSPDIELKDKTSVVLYYVFLPCLIHETWKMGPSSLVFLHKNRHFPLAMILEEKVL